MDPTPTEHDFRFPRRPDLVPARGCTTGRAIPDGLLGDALFPALQSDSPDSLDQMRRDDPLATQVWKFFKTTKQQLPNQQRMENLTWRMIALGMRNHARRDEEPARYGAVARRAAAPGLTPEPRRPATAPNAPSGIAQLRKTSENNAPDAMNVDDFFLAAGHMSPPPLPCKAPDGPTGAIPIKLRRDSASQFVPMSLPHDQRPPDDEFDYVTRHHRKTSIDERRVSAPPPVWPAALRPASRRRPSLP